MTGLEARLRALWPRDQPVPPAWLAWATGDELDRLEEVYFAVETGQREWTELDQLLCIAVEAAAIRRMMAAPKR